MLVAAVLALSACAKDSVTSPGNLPRTFAMGFTDWPYAASTDGIAFPYRVLRTDADLVTDHFDAGVPWQEIDAAQVYAAEVEGEIARKLSNTPAGHVVYIATTPINFLRNGLADHWGHTASEPNIAPWDTASFNNPRVVATYIAFCKDMIARFHPQYFAYAIEANLLAKSGPAKWPNFLIMARQVYAELKRSYPSLLVFPSIQIEQFYADRALQSTAIGRLLPYSDLIAVSTYPYAGDYPDPTTIPADYFRTIAALAPGKAFAIAETAWPAEPVGPPYPITIPASAAWQRIYVDRLLGDLTSLNAKFVNYFSTRDYDDLWDTTLKDLPIAPLVRIWRDTGLYAGDGTERPALQVWRSYLSRIRK